MEALPIFMDKIFPTWAAILISGILVLAFVEIIPQAVCSRYGLSLGAKLSALVRLLALFFFQLSYPISKLLDLLLGKERFALLRRAELKTLVALHANEAGKGGELSHHETTIIVGALDLTQKTAKDAMTPISKTFGLDINLRLNMVYDNWPLYDILKQFLKGQSHMAIVVKSKEDVQNTGNNAVDKTDMLKVNPNPKEAKKKGLIFPLAEKEKFSFSTEASPLYSSELEIQSATLKNVMEQDNNFHPQYKIWQQGGEIISAKDLESLPGNLDEEVIGIITLEDVLEALLQENILDETDAYIDVHTNMEGPHRPTTLTQNFYHPNPTAGRSCSITWGSCIHMALSEMALIPLVKNSFFRPNEWRKMELGNRYEPPQLFMFLLCMTRATCGLALGLLSFSQIDLEVLVKSGQFQDQKNAAKILPLVKNEHLLLCTLLIGKSLAMEALPIFLDSILPTWAAILISVTLVMTFAEIIPQAVCSRYGLSIGAKMSGLVRLLVVVFFPISYPIGKLLDWLLGKGHSVLRRRAELKTLVDLHANEAGKGGELSHHETMIIGGALDLTQKTAKDAMTPISETFSLDINSKLDMHKLALIMSKGHSRVPIYSGNPTNIIGVILVKNLIFCRPEDETPIKHLTIRSIPRVFDNWPLYNILNQFQKGHSHIAVVVKSKKHGEHAAGKLSVMNGNTKSILHPTSKERKGANLPFVLKEHLDESPSCSSDTEYCTPSSKNYMEKNTGLHAQYKQWENGDDKILYESLESFQRDMEEEAIGIITMEDVMEQLLQEDILDETDRYVYVHNKIKVNLKASRRSLSTSPGKSFSHLHCRSSEFSPLSSYTPILRSPIATYTQPPPIRPTLYASPGNSTPKPPGPSVGPVFGSPSSH